MMNENQPIVLKFNFKFRPLLDFKVVSYHCQSNCMLNKMLRQILLHQKSGYQNFDKQFFRVF